MSQYNNFSILDDELRELSFEKDVKTTLKTQEELNKVTVDETLNDIDRAVHLLSSGQEVQCISVIRNLLHLLKTFQSDCVQKVIPKLKDFLKNAGLDVQLVAAEIFQCIIREKVFSAVAFAKYFLPTVLKNMTLRDPVAAQAWFSCMIAAIPYLPKEVVQKDILSMAKQRGKLMQPSGVRQSCCELLGALALRFEPAVIKVEIIPTMKQLCQDIDFGVRACMSTHLLSIASSLGAVETKNLILNEALELAADEEYTVQGAALDCLIKMDKLLDENTIKQNVLPLVCKYCEAAITGHEIQLIHVAENLGRFYHRLKEHSNTTQRAQLIEVYRQLCKMGRRKVDVVKGDCTSLVCNSANMESSKSSNLFDALENNTHMITCRRHCAFNFPAFTLFCGTESFESQLRNVLSLLCTDPDDTVRKQLAAGMHEVALTLAGRSSLIYPHVVWFLRESRSPLVLNSFIQKLPDTLTAVVVGGNLPEATTFGVPELCNSILAAISQLEMAWPTAWRPLAALASHFATFPDTFPADVVYAKLVPVAFKLLNKNQYLPVRRNVAISLCSLMRRNRRNYQRNDMCHRFVHEFGCSSRFRHRLMFITICFELITLFSKAYFKEHFFERVLKLCDDRVSNIRLRVCDILPILKGLLQLPRDRSLHLQLEAKVRKMTSSESDRDVNAALNLAISRMDQIKLTVDTLNVSQTVSEDRIKEDDERAIIEMEEKGVDEHARPDGRRGSRRSISLHSAPVIKVPVHKSGRDLSKSSQQANVFSPSDIEDYTHGRLHTKSPTDVKLSPGLSLKSYKSTGTEQQASASGKQNVPLSSFLPTKDSKEKKQPTLRKASPTDRPIVESSSAIPAAKPAAKSPAALKKKITYPPTTSKK